MLLLIILSFTLIEVILNSILTTWSQFLLFNALFFFYSLLLLMFEVIIVDSVEEIDKIIEDRKKK